MEVPMASGATPLVISAQKGYREIVRSLLQHGAQTDTAGAHGLNALHLAAYGGFAEIIALLAAAGADLDAQDDRYASALHYAVLKSAPCVFLLASFVAFASFVVMAIFH